VCNLFEEQYIWGVNSKKIDSVSVTIDSSNLLYYRLADQWIRGVNSKKQIDSLCQLPSTPLIYCIANLQNSGYGEVALKNSTPCVSYLRLLSSTVLLLLAKQWIQGVNSKRNRLPASVTIDSSHLLYCTVLLICRTVDTGSYLSSSQFQIYAILP
jgi:hypothetical protein